MIVKGAIVLCGGQSKRMGRSKAMLPFGDEPMLLRVLHRLERVADVRVVVAANGQSLPELPAGVVLTRDERPDRGPLQGMHAGLQCLPPNTTSAYITSCDVPFLEPELVRYLFSLLTDETDIVVPRDDARFHPLAAVYRRGVVRQIDALLHRNELRPRALFQLVPTLAIDMQSLRQFDPALASFQNINHLHEYHSALVQAGLEPPVTDSTSTHQNGPAAGEHEL